MSKTKCIYVYRSKCFRNPPIEQNGNCPFFALWRHVCRGYREKLKIKNLKKDQIFYVKVSGIKWKRIIEYKVLEVSKKEIKVFLNKQMKLVRGLLIEEQVNKSEQILSNNQIKFLDIYDTLYQITSLEGEKHHDKI